MTVGILKSPFDQREFITYGVGIFGPYEPHVTHLFKNITKPNSICLDLGALVGFHSLMLAYLVPEGMVYSFEPSPEMYANLCKNIEANNMPNIEAINKGVFDQEGDFEFIENIGVGQSHIIQKDSGLDPSRVISCVVIDDWVKTKNIPQIDIIKMDIEGAEVNAIQGAMTSITTWKPDMVIEFNSNAASFLGYAPEDLIYLLQNIYPQLYLIQPDNSLTKIHNYEELITLTDNIKGHYGVTYNQGEIYCTFKD